MAINVNKMLVLVLGYYLYLKELSVTMLSIKKISTLLILCLSLLLTACGGSTSDSTTKPFITTWTTEGLDNDYQIEINTDGAGGNYKVEWGDGVINKNVRGSITHTYDAIGLYTVKISGDFPQIRASEKYSRLNNGETFSGTQWQVHLVEHLI
jgi:hypothetical protein